jgi:hypothetical protein
MPTGNEMPSDLTREIRIINHGSDWIPYKDDLGRDCIRVRETEDLMPVTPEDEEDDEDE